MLYSLVTCPHRVAQDLFANPADRDPVSPFVQLLWEKGTTYERETIAKLAVPFVDLSIYSGDEKERRTTEAIRNGAPLIYGARISAGDLLGDPDLLRKQNGGYVAGDIKSGSGEEGPEDNRKPKLSYAVQLGIYTDILERKGWSAARTPFIWDVNGEEVTYELEAPFGVKNPTTLWTEYQNYLDEARRIANHAEQTTPAYSSPCKMCWWYTKCLEELECQDDLTLIPELGRSRRTTLVGNFPNIASLAEADINKFITGKKTVFNGIGPPTLTKFSDRAKLLKSSNPRPYLKSPIVFPASETEIFFDIEVDPMREICYLHGFIERRNGDNGTERYVSCFADAVSPDAEEAAFTTALRYLRAHPTAIVYYYSKYERTWWRNLQQKFPNACLPDEIEALFDPNRAIDLYHDVVQKKTEWPTRDYSIKTLAQYLGFTWRDSNPSGAASIEWFDRWVQTGDPAIQQRILNYNEDDCRATRVLLDAIRQMT
jgi:predicted RecB family nuclease